MFFKKDHKFYERHLHPSVFKRLNRTRELIQKGVDPGEFRYRGGLDLKTYNAILQRQENQEQKMKDHKQEVIAQYGSIKRAPITIGPCRKIDPVIGIKNALVLLTEFKDIKHTHTPDEFEKLLFSKGSKHSLRDYYLEVSGNKLDITGKVNDQWYTTSKNSSEYVDDAVSLSYPLAEKLVKETILDAKNSRNIDFAPFARNGIIDILFVVFAGKGRDTSINIDQIQPHQGQLSEPIEVQSGIQAKRYALVSELPLDDIGCYCHELGHLLGLPDLYNWNSPVVGYWCLMAIGDHIEDGKTPAHPSAWCKIHLGWKQPKVIRELPKNYEIPAVMDNGDIYKIEIQGSDGEEYFLLENRQQKGFDRNLPGSGLLIWHINQSNCVHKAPNSDPKSLFLTLKESDGKNDLQMNAAILYREKGEDAAEKLLGGDTGDAYPGITVNRNFDDKSNPNSNSYKGDKSLVSVTSISDSGDIMKALIGIQSLREATAEASKIIASGKPEVTGLKSEHKVPQSQGVFLSKFIALMSAQKSKDPYSEGYEEGKKDSLDKIKKKEGLDFYQYGYKLGYRRGYRKALKKLKK